MACETETKPSEKLDSTEGLKMWRATFEDLVHTVKDCPELFQSSGGNKKIHTLHHCSVWVEAGKDVRLMA